MNCQTCQERMAELADARLDEKAAASVRAHIDGCPDCRREFETFNRTLEALDTLRSAPPSHRLRARVMGHIETATSRTGPRPFARPPRPAGAPGTRGAS